MTLLIHHLAEYEYLREQLQAEYQEADEQTLRDTLEGLSSLPEALAAVVRSYLDDLALQTCLLNLSLKHVPPGLRIELFAVQILHIVTKIGDAPGDV